MKKKGKIMKNCPRCGAKLDPNSKFCPQCGLDLAKAQKKQFKPAKKQSQVRKICLSIAAWVIAIAAVVTLFLVVQSSLGQHGPATNSTSSSQNQDPLASYLHGTKISPQKLVALAVAYAHKKFKNSDWDAVYSEARQGNLSVTKYGQASLGNYSFQAPKDGAIYLVSPSAGCIISDTEDLIKSKVTFIDSDKGTEKAISLKNLAMEIFNNSSKKELKQLNGNITFQDASSQSKNTSSDKLSWNDDKEAKLAEFMAGFGKKMKQKYQEYTGDKELKTLSGEEYPAILSQMPFRLYSDDSNDTQKIDIEWDPSLKSDAEYKVVSIFNCNVGAPEAHITYLFCVHDNQPVALVDQTTNGNDVRVKPTANSDVSSAFANIIEGEDAN